MDLDELRADLEQIIRESDAALAVLDEEQVEDDEETIDSDADREEALLKAAAERRTEAMAALARMADGSYGRCVDCGSAIPQERLTFRPEAARCLACQEKFEQA